MQVERNLASGAKNLFMPHMLVAEQVTALVYPTFLLCVLHSYYVSYTLTVYPALSLCQHQDL